MLQPTACTWIGGRTFTFTSGRKSNLRKLAPFKTHVTTHIGSTRFFACEKKLNLGDKSHSRKMDLSGKSGQSLNPRAAAPSNGLPGQTTMYNSGFEYHNEAVSNPSAVIFTFFNDVVVLHPTSCSI